MLSLTNIAILYYSLGCTYFILGTVSMIINMCNKNEK